MVYFDFNLLYLISEPAVCFENPKNILQIPFSTIGIQNFNHGSLYNRAGSKILRKGGVAPGKDCERQKHEAPGEGGLGVLPQKNLKIHVCQMHFPGLKKSLHCQKWGGGYAPHVPPWIRDCCIQISYKDGTSYGSLPLCTWFWNKAAEPTY